MRDIIIVAITLLGMLVGVYLCDDILAAMGISAQPAAPTSVQPETPAAEQSAHSPVS